MAEYRVDELARAAGTTVRNVRVYQDRGLLPPPRREGRVGIYTEVHLARLRLIGHLLERGYTFAHITELISAWEQGRDVAQLLGLEVSLTGPWSDEVPTYVSAGDLLQLFGPQATPEALRRAVELRIIEPEGLRFRVPSPKLLHAGTELVAAGVPLDAVLELAGQLRKDLDGVARRFVALVATHVFDRLCPDGLPDDEQIPGLAEIVSRLRPLAQMSVDAELARAMERQAHAQLGERLARVLDHLGEAGAEDRNRAS
jgi:DNA-binding transcriptional MerR regulator